MGNRLANGAWSPKKRAAGAKRKSRATGTADSAAAVAATAANVAPVAPRASVVGAVHATAEAVAGTPRDGADAAANAPLSPQPHWPHVVATIIAADAFESPVSAAHQRERERRERQAQRRADPALFFAAYASDGNAIDSDDVAMTYAHALLLMADGSDHEAVTHAAALLRPLAMRPVATPLAADARARLAQCLLLLDPTLRTSAVDVEMLLVECVRGDVDETLAQQATELLAHVRLARGQVHDAQGLFDRFLTQPAAVELDFQRACCRHLVGASPVARNGDLDQSSNTLPTTSPSAALVLLTVDADELRVGLQ